MIPTFKSEFYAEKGEQLGSYYLHFYKLQRAKDCSTFLKHTPSPFSNTEMIFHKKEETPEGDIIVRTEEGTQVIGKRKKKKKEEDEDGFMLIT